MVESRHVATNQMFLHMSERFNDMSDAMLLLQWVHVPYTLQIVKNVSLSYLDGEDVEALNHNR